MAKIELYDKWASTNNSHGMTAAQVKELNSRMDKFSPQIVSTGEPSSRLRSIFEDVLPPGASWSLGNRTSQMLSNQNGGGRVMNTNQMPYQPEFSDPSRQNYPVHRILANRYWRLFHKLDPLIGNCIEMYSTLPWSNFELTGEGIEGEVRQAYEYMCRETQILSLLPQFVSEFLVAGECVPHTWFDDTKGVFTYISLFNPDQVEVIDAPFIKMDPLVQFIPDDRLRSVLTSSEPALAKLRESIPEELTRKLNSKEPITLSPINCTFIPRKLHPYDTRGTSLLSRMWRILMYEDAIFNSSIQTARRSSSPLKVAKLGNASTGWIPPPEQEKKLLELLVQAEQDPMSWLVYHYGISFELIGTNDRAMSINREWDSIEKMKLAAMGISKSFVTGEVTYASASTGLQVFLQRLKSMRMFFEQKWMYPKFFKPIAEINGWIKPKPSEVSHRYRVKRSARELDEQNAYLMPKIVWDKSLDPQINSDLIAAMTGLEALGVKFSKTTKMAAAGYSFEEETKKIHREAEFEKQFLPSSGGDQQAQGGPGGAPGGGAGPPPGAPPEEMEESGPGEAAPPGAGGELPPNVDGRPTPEPASKGINLKSDEGSKPESKDKIWNTEDMYGSWTKSEYAEYTDMLDDPQNASADWHDLSENQKFQDALAVGDMESVWGMTQDFLDRKGYPYKDVDELRSLLELDSRMVPPESVDLINKTLDALPDDAASLSDDDFVNLVAKTISKNKIAKVANDAFLIGNSSSSGRLIGDVSSLMKNK